MQGMSEASAETSNASVCDDVTTRSLATTPCKRSDEGRRQARFYDAERNAPFFLLRGAPWFFVPSVVKFLHSFDLLAQESLGRWAREEPLVPGKWPIGVLSSALMPPTG